MSSGRFDRLLMAGIVGETPTNKIKVKKKITYIFPEIGDHEITYYGRRYIVIKAIGEYPVKISDNPEKLIDLESCDFILLDGKECRPIATFRQNSENKLIGKLVGWTFAEEFSEIRKAIREMARKTINFKSR
jgi:hypothetical protein